MSFGPAVELVALADVVEEGDAHAAGGLDEVDVEHEHLAGAGDFGVVEMAARRVSYSVL